MKKIILSLLLLNLSLLANSVATITAMRGDADIKRDGELIIASLGAKLEQKDNILTKDNSKLQVIFKDETIISIGKNSDFSIQEYLFEDNQAPVAKFSMLRGAMRTITGQIGNIAPQRFSVATETATIGIRGTNFSIFVEEDGSSSAFCTFGAISVVIAGTTHVVQQGFYIALSPKGEVTIKEFTPEVLKEKKEKYFDPDEKKKDVVTYSGDDVKQDEENTDSANTAQLDVTTDDNSGMIISDVSDTVTDTTQQAPSLSDTIAGYTMNNAQYTGTYTSSNPEIFKAGNAQLDIDFGADTVDLKLTPTDATDYVQFNQSPTFTGTQFNVSGNTQGTGGIRSIVSGSATGTFGGTTGNSVTGTYTFNPDAPDDISGTYSVTSSQTLQ